MSALLPSLVRGVRLDDVPELVALCRQLGYRAEERAMHDRVDRLMSRPLVHRVVVVPSPGNDRRLQGALHATRREVLESDDFVEISGLIVDERERRAGVGRALVQAAERWARDLGVGAVRLRSNAIREEAHVFYQRLGFRVLKEQVAFVKEL